MEKQPLSAESIARLADKKQDLSSYFTNDGKMMPPLEIDEIHPSGGTTEELNDAASENRGTDLRP